MGLYSAHIQLADQANWIAIAGITSLSVLPLAIISSLYVIIRVYRRYRREGRVSLVHRIPLYIAIAHMFKSLWSIGYIQLQWHYGQPWQDPMCTMWNFLWELSIAVVAFLTIYLAMVTVYRLLTNLPYKLGPYDIYFLTPPFVVSVIWTCTQLGHWGVADGMPYCEYNSTVVPWKNMIALMLGVVAITIFYTAALIKVKKSLTSQAKRAERLAIKKFISYTVMFYIDAVPLVFYYLNYTTFPYGKQSVPLFALGHVAAIFGAVTNTISYIFNEGWTDRAPMNIATRTRSNVHHAQKYCVKCHTYHADLQSVYGGAAFVDKMTCPFAQSNRIASRQVVFPEKREDLTEIAEEQESYRLDRDSWDWRDDAFDVPSLYDDSSIPNEETSSWAFFSRRANSARHVNEVALPSQPMQTYQSRPMQRQRSDALDESAGDYTVLPPSPMRLPGPDDPPRLLFNAGHRDVQVDNGVWGHRVDHVSNADASYAQYALSPPPRRSTSVGTRQNIFPNTVQNDSSSSLSADSVMSDD